MRVQADYKLGENVLKEKELKANGKSSFHGEKMSSRLQRCVGKFFIFVRVSASRYQKL